MNGTRISNKTLKPRLATSTKCSWINQFNIYAHEKHWGKTVRWQNIAGNKHRLNETGMYHQIHSQWEKFTGTYKRHNWSRGVLHFSNPRSLLIAPVCILKRTGDSSSKFKWTTRLLEKDFRSSRLKPNTRRTSGSGKVVRNSRICKRRSQTYFPIGGNKLIF